MIVIWYQVILLLLWGTAIGSALVGVYTIAELRKRSKQVELKLYGDVCLWDESMFLENLV